jgi:pyruvate-formate lyase
MKGHIRQRSPGHWAIVIDVRDPQSGRRKRRWHSFTGTKRQAQVEAARLISEQQKGTTVEPSRMTVAAFLERWIEHMQGQVSPRSHERYAELCRATAGRPSADEIAAGPHQRGLRQSAY